MYAERIYVTQTVHMALCVPLFELKASHDLPVKGPSATNPPSWHDQKLKSIARMLQFAVICRLVNKKGLSASLAGAWTPNRV